MIAKAKKFDLRLFLKSFWQMVGILRIFLLQAGSLYLLSYTCGLLAEAAGVRGCAPRPDLLNWKLGVFVAGSLLLGYFSISPIIFPRVTIEEIYKELAFSNTGLRFPFFSTHPSYILLDMMLLIPAGVLFWAGQSETLCEFNAIWGQGWAALMIALFFPLMRLLFWFVLGKQIYAMQMRNIYQGIIWGYIIFLPAVIFASYSFASSNIIPRLNIPRIEPANYLEGIDKHPEATEGLIRLKGVVKRGIAKCGLFGQKDRNDYPYATIILDMGRGNGEIIVQAKTPQDVVNLEIEAKNKLGQWFEAYGRLSKLPNAEKKMICGLEKLSMEPPRGGRALLEIETPK